MGEFFTLLIAILGMFIWVRTESRADLRHQDAKIDSIRELVRSIHEEIKDFHNRLIEIERNKK